MNRAREGKSGSNAVPGKADNGRPGWSGQTLNGSVRSMTKKVRDWRGLIRELAGLVSDSDGLVSNLIKLIGKLTLLGISIATFIRLATG